MANLSRRDFLKAAGAGVCGAFAVTQNVSAAKPITDPSDHIAMLFDSTLCVGCNACTNACRQWNNTQPELDPEGLYDAPRELAVDTWTLIQLYQDPEADSHAFVKRQCMHCVEPACVSGCPVHALVKTELGAVTYNAARCIGCRYCMYACPFHVPRFEWDKALFPVIAKCTLCYDRIIQGQGTACAEICPTGALIWGRRGDLVAEAESRIAAHPDLYVDHIYGKQDAGGTSVLYLANQPFEELGLEDFGPEPVPAISESTGNLFIPAILVGGPILLASIRYIAKKDGWG